jgi:hypothetical protein
MFIHDLNDKLFAITKFLSLEATRQQLVNTYIKSCQQLLQNTNDCGKSLWMGQVAIHR